MNDRYSWVPLTTFDYNHRAMTADPRNNKMSSWRPKSYTSTGYIALVMDKFGRQTLRCVPK